MHYEWMSEQWAWGIENACIGCSVDKNQHPNTVITSNKMHIEKQCLLLSHRIIVSSCFANPKAQWLLFCGDEIFHRLYALCSILYTSCFTILKYFLYSFSTYCFVRFYLFLFSSFSCSSSFVFGEFFFIQFIISIFYCRK